MTDEFHREILSQLGMGIDEDGRYWITPPIEQTPPVVPAGTVSDCAVRIQLRLCVRELRAQLVLELGEECVWCAKSKRRGWKHCRDHELLAALERVASTCVTEYGRAWDWAYALGYAYAPTTYESADGRGKASEYDAALAFARDYARAVTDAF